MAVLQMQRVSICALKKDRKSILERLQSMGVMEVSQVLEDESGFEKQDTQGTRILFEKKASSADQALEILQEYAPEKTSFLSSLEGKALIEKEKYAESISKKEDIMNVVSDLVGWQKEIAECRANIQKTENQIEALSPWLSLDVPMNFEGTGSVKALIGSFSSVMTLEEIYTLTAEHAPDVEGVDVTILSSDRDSTYVVVLCLREQAELVENALRQGGFASGYMGSKGLLTAFLVAFFVCNVYRFCVKRNITIHMPEEVPPNISQTFADVIPFAISILLLALFDIAFRNAAGMCFAQAVIEFFQPLFTAADGYLGLAVIYGAMSLFWFVGIQGPSIVEPAVSAIYYVNIANNLSLIHI